MDLSCYTSDTKCCHTVETGFVVQILVSFYHSPCLWKSKPEDLRTTQNMDIFKLKTYLFSLI